MRSLLKKSDKQQDWVKFFGDSMPPQTRKQHLIDECKRLDVSIYVDDVSESSSGVYAELRGIASEAELDQRITAKKAVLHSRHANFIAIAALIVSIGSFAIALYALKTS